MLLLINLAIFNVPLSLPADGTTNLGGQKLSSERTSIEGVISLFVSGTGNVELLGQVIFFLVRIYQMEVVYRHECHLSRSAEESRHLVPSLSTKSTSFSEMRRISYNRIFDIIFLPHSVLQSISSCKISYIIQSWDRKTVILGKVWRPGSHASASNECKKEQYVVRR